MPTSLHEKKTVWRQWTLILIFCVDVHMGWTSLPPVHMRPPEPVPLPPPCGRHKWMAPNCLYIVCFSWLIDCIGIWYFIFSMGSVLVILTNISMLSVGSWVCVSWYSCKWSLILWLIEYIKIVWLIEQMKTNWVNEDWFVDWLSKWRLIGWLIEYIKIVWLIDWVHKDLR